MRAIGGVAFGIDRPGLDEVRGDIARPEIARQPAHHSAQRRLARGVERRACPGRAVGDDTADHDDAATRDHLFGNALCGNERGADIDVELPVKGILGITVETAAGVLVAGHGRVMAAKRLGMTSVPAIRLRHLTEAQARALRLADNQIALNSGWDEALLAAEIARIRDED
eukprot:gene35018-biopygen22837